MATDPRRASIEANNKEVHAEASRRTRRSFVVAGAAVAAAGAGFIALLKSRPIGMLREPMRKAEELNRAIAEHVIGETALAPTYPLAMAAKRARLNGMGLRRDLDPASWRLQVAGLSHEAELHPRFMSDLSEWKFRFSEEFVARNLELDGESANQPINVSKMVDSAAKLDPRDPLAFIPERLPSAAGLLLAMEDLKKLPFTEYATEFKCIEGWSQIMHFGGVRFIDFMKAFPPMLNRDGSLPKYVAMATADGAYFAGYEIAAMVHPQTLLCYQMSGEELLPAHGWPLRLSMPLKYGYKQIKQIARITYTNQRPIDYWEQFGYDWHGGL
ncbi:molybdopterin-dependent oxidoreductase [Edaphobacter flagellatus]|uniref:molybdopterin-dependent oxidoreductase n=1 Tax=Edaphobacter flagellatus TaxID=1933044 RepID=UPI0021B175FC|nr:molybdopterin-dependent oxidoreductase [Edaphobacter flagellatus]